MVGCCIIEPRRQFTGELVHHLLARAGVRLEVRGSRAVVAALMALAIPFKFTLLEATLGKVDGLQRHQRITRAGTAEESGQGPVGNQNPQRRHI